MTDPRYDPRFQRGWNGEAPSARPAPPAEPVDVPATPLGPVVAEPAAAEPARPAEPADHPAAADGTPSSARNPYRVALAVGGVVLLLAAAALVWRTLQGNATGGAQTPLDYIVAGLLPQLASFLVLAGLIALIVAIALGALPRRR